MKQEMLVADKEELLKVYDENHRFFGKYERRSRVHDNQLYHDETILWVLNPYTKQVLVQKRSPNKRFMPNRYGLCAGHVVKGETVHDTLKKEAMEELGIDIDKYEVRHVVTVKKIVPQNYHFDHHYCVLAEIPVSEFKIQKEELSEVKYINYEDFKYLVRTNDDSVAVNWTYAEKQAFDRIDKIIYNKKYQRDESK